VSSRAAAACLLLPILALLGACCGASPGKPDPYQRANRAIFSFNDKVDAYALEPVSKGWAFITPKAFRVGLDKVFKNLKFPVRFVSNLGQGEVRGGGSELARFVVNSTIGLLGFFDPASRMGLGQYDEDFGQMFGRWGIRAGPYWVIPIVGPSNPRDGWGYLFNTALNPLTYVGGGIVAIINGRAILAPQVDLAREASLDYYVFVRDAYLQRRAALVSNEAWDEAQPVADDLYDLPDDLYEVEDDLDDMERNHVP